MRLADEKKYGKGPNQQPPRAFEPPPMDDLGPDESVSNVGGPMGSPTGHNIWTGLDKQCGLCKEHFKHLDVLVRLQCRHAHHEKCWNQYRRQYTSGCCPACKGFGAVIAQFDHIGEETIPDNGAIPGAINKLRPGPVQRFEIQQNDLPTPRSLSQVARRTHPVEAFLSKNSRDASVETFQTAGGGSGSRSHSVGGRSATPTLGPHEREFQEEPEQSTQAASERGRPRNFDLESQGSIGSSCLVKDRNSRISGGISSHFPVVPDTWEDAMRWLEENKRSFVPDHAGFNWSMTQPNKCPRTNKVQSWDKPNPNYNPYQRNSSDPAQTWPKSQDAGISTQCTYHENTVLDSGEPALMVDIGSVGNLAGDEWVKRVALAGAKHGRRPESWKRDRPLGVQGVGVGAQYCSHNIRLPIAIPTEKDCMKATFTCPVVPKSSLPALLGLQSLQDCNTLIDTRNEVAYLLGPGTPEWSGHPTLALSFQIGPGTPDWPWHLGLALAPWIGPGKSDWHKPFNFEHSDQLRKFRIEITSALQTCAAIFFVSDRFRTFWMVSDCFWIVPRSF